MNGVRLTVNGKEYSGWTSININRGIEQIAGTYELSVTERWPGQPGKRPIRPGQSCTVKMNNETVITGYVDDVIKQIDESSHTVTVKGRDKTGDLVDCSAIYKSGGWKNKTLQAIAIDLCKPFGIDVIVETDVGVPFETVQIDQGETVFEILDRLARQRGVLLGADGRGNLLLTRAGTKRLPIDLRQGVNIKTATGSFSRRDRYSVYIGKGQHAGDDNILGAAANEPTAQVVDKDIRYRPLVVIGEDNATIDSLKKRITWQRNVNYGRSTNVVVTVAGWSYQNNLLFHPNKLVQVMCSEIGANAELLISNVNNVLDDNGSMTQLTLKGPSAFDVLDIPETNDEAGFI